MKIEQCIFILGLNTDKNISAIWKQLLGLSRLCIATCSQNPRSMAPSDIAEVVTTFGGTEDEVITTETVAEAIERARAIATEDDVICITGSIYVVGEAREHILREDAWKLTTSR